MQRPAPMKLNSFDWSATHQMLVRKGESLARVQRVELELVRTSLCVGLSTQYCVLTEGFLIGGRSIARRGAPRRAPCWLIRMYFKSRKHHRHHGQ